MWKALPALALGLAVSFSPGCGCGGGAGETDGAAPDAHSDAAPASDAAVLSSDLGPAPIPVPPVEGDIFPDGPGPGANGGPYPIVLCHGMAGFVNIGPLEYWFGVAEHLTDLGHDVFVTQVPMFASVADRAAVLAPQIDQILLDSGAAKLNLVGHSQGGLDIRYLVSTLGYGPVVASITTVATPHGGTEIADVIHGIAPAPAFDLASVLVDLFDAAAGQAGEQDVATALADMTTVNMATVFNPANPDDPGVSYFSVTGECELPPYFIGVQDLCDIEVQLTHVYLSSVAGPNDGLVSVSSATWGTFLGTIPADHLDEVGQIGGITSLAFDHLEFYADLADFLVNQGF